MVSTTMISIPRMCYLFVMAYIDIFLIFENIIGDPRETSIRMVLFKENIK